MERDHMGAFIGGGLTRRDVLALAAGTLAAGVLARLSPLRLKDS